MNKILLAVLTLYILTFGNMLTQADTCVVCRSVNKSIPDNNLSGVTDTFTVSGLPSWAIITKVQVRFDTLIHTWVGDLIMSLSKGSRTVTFCRRPGPGTNGSSGDNFFGTVFSDSARYNIDSITSISGNGQLSSPFNGYFRGNFNAPNTATSTAMFSDFNGHNDPNGKWILSVRDSFPDDFGILKRHCLIIDYLIETGINYLNTEIPNKYFLEQNYPNPFNPATNIKFGLPYSENVKLVVLDILGKEVAVLADGNFNAGEYSANFNASSLASGIYFYKLTSGNFSQTKKMLLIK